MTQNDSPTPFPRSSARKIALASLLPLALLVASCASSPGAEVNPAPPAAEGVCGDVPIAEPNDPEGLVPELSPALQERFNGYANPLMSSAWADYEGNSEPLMVGFVAIPPTGQSNQDFNQAIEDGFDKAKAEGRVEGELLVSMPTDFATMTPADQIRGYQDLVSQGVDVIILHPLSGDAMIPAVDEAGEAGIPTIAGNTIVDSKYSVTVANNWFNAAAIPLAGAMKILDGKGNAVIVQGAEGSSTNTTLVNATEKVLAMCPDLKVVGKVSGGYTNSVAQSALVTFMASHPEQIDLAMSLGIMGTGTFSAFEQVGRATPVVVDINASAASMAYWDAAADATGYEGAGTSNTSYQEATAVWETAMRIMDGQGPKLNIIVPNMSVITPDNYLDFVVPGEDTTSVLDALPQDDWASKEVMDEFFNNPTS